MEVLPAWLPLILAAATAFGAIGAASAALWQANTARRRHEEQTKADRERRITETFAKATEQLGSDKREVRLGAIYTFERLAEESDREYWPIMETLTAFVRERAPWPPAGTQAGLKALEESQPGAEPCGPDTDIQAVLTVLARRSKARQTRPRGRPQVEPQEL